MDRWGVYSVRLEKVVAIGTEDRVTLVDAFGYLFGGVKLQEVDLPEELARRVNPVYTRQFQVHPGVNKGRIRVATNCKLTEEQVVEIKLAMSKPGWRVSFLAVKYNVTPGTIGAISKGRSWNHIPGPPVVPPNAPNYVAPTPGTRLLSDLDEGEIQRVRDAAATMDVADVAQMFGLSALDVLKATQVGC